MRGDALRDTAEPSVDVTSTSGSFRFKKEDDIKEGEMVNVCGKCSDVRVWKSSGKSAAVGGCGVDVPYKLAHR